MTSASTIERLDSQLDPELAQALKLMSEISAGGAEQVRDHVESLVAAELERTGVVRERVVVDADGPVSAIVYRAASRPRNAPVVLWVHGGAFKVDIDVSAPEAVRLAAAGAVVVSPDYRLAPAHPYPAAIEDCYAVLEWIGANADELGADMGRLVAAGKSTGAGLVAALMLMARDRQGPTVALQVLVEPQLDDRLETASGLHTIDARIWDRNAVSSSWAAYLSGGTTADQYAAAARAEDLTGLPPAYVSVAQFDATRDEALLYAARLASASVPVDLHLWPGTFHSFALIAPDAEISRRSSERETAKLMKALGLDLKSEGAGS